MTLSRPPEPDFADEISHVLGDWQRLIRAYPPPHDPFGGALLAEPVWSHPRTVEFVLEVYRADEAVFHPVVNYVGWLHYRITVVELVID